MALSTRYRVKKQGEVRKLIKTKIAHFSLPQRFLEKYFFMFFTHLCSLLILLN